MKKWTRLAGYVGVALAHQRLAEAYEKKADNSAAMDWYDKSLSLIKNEDVKQEVRKRIEELSKGSRLDDK